MLKFLRFSGKFLSLDYGNWILIVVPISLDFRSVLKFKKEVKKRTKRIHKGK